MTATQQFLTDQQAHCLRIIHTTRHVPLGPSARHVPDLVARGFCKYSPGSSTRSRLTEAGYDKLLEYIKLQEA